jgi:hypothetical protein
VPRSRDPQFYRYWVSEKAVAVDVEGICAQWEGRRDNADGAPSADANSGAET